MSDSPARPLEAIEHEVRAVIECYRDRFNASDADGLAQLYAPEIWFVNQGGASFVGRRAIRDQQAEGFRGPLGRITIAMDVEGLSTLGVDHVLARIRQTITDPDAAHGSASASTTSMVLDHTAGSWLIRHLQNTPIQPPWTDAAGA